MSSMKYINIFLCMTVVGVCVKKEELMSCTIIGHFDILLGKNFN